MENDKTQILKRLKEANNVLVTVSQNPSVDQLSAAIGMTLVLNKLGKHGTAVFSGAAPSTIEFLKPEETLEKTTDSLRDFIIALDKSKADKLRYKVEDQHVKIFITPYRTTITQEDLDFSHGDFNVDVVLALGVHIQQDLDQAITAHGRILHDATVVSINTNGQGELGGINYSRPEASSLSEVLANLSSELKGDIFDAQIATAFLTGIVAETDRFSNEKTKPDTMSVSAKLMAAGANQQLVATKLAEPEQPKEPELPPQEDEPTYSTGEAGQSNDGSLDINHAQEQDAVNKIHIDEHGNVGEHKEEPEQEKSTEENQQESVKDDEETPDTSRSRRILEPPTHGGTLTASGNHEELEPSTDPLSVSDAKDQPILSHDSTKDSRESAASDVSTNKPDSGGEDQPSELPEPQLFQPPQPEPTPIESPTLDDLEKSVDSPHQEAATTTPDEAKDNKAEETPDLNQLQSAVSEALATGDSQQPLEPIEALNANPVNLDLGHGGESAASSSSAPASAQDDYLDVSSLDSSSEVSQLSNAAPPQDNLAGSVEDPSAPPPVPPPMMPPSQHDDNNDMTLPPIPQ